MRILVAGLLAALVVTGCSGTPTDPASPSPTPSPSATPLPTRSPAPYAGSTGSGEYAGVELSADAFGPIRLGLEVPEGQTRGWVERLSHCDRWGSSPELLAEGVDLIFDDSDRLTEIWLGNPVHATTEGARVGMTMEEIAYLYGSRLQFEQRTSLGSPLQVPFVRAGEHELVFYAIGDKDEIPGALAPVSAIGARTLGTDIDRPAC